MFSLCDSSTSTVNAEEIAKFSSFSANWWNPRGEFAPLHRLNSLRVPLVKEVASSVLQSPESPTSEPPPAGTGSVSSHGNSLENLHVLDIGCGGGLLSEVNQSWGFCCPSKNFVHML